MLVERIVGDAHLRDAGEFGRRRGGSRDILARDEHVDRRAELQRGGERARGQIAQMPVRDLGQKKRRHG